MKIVERYCKKCKALTKHTVEKETKGFERVFGAIFTVGMTELDNATIYMCVKCEEETRTSLMD
jgi:hypothetical protein